jgi:hypothetical protein
LLHDDRAAAVNNVRQIHRYLKKQVGALSKDSFFLLSLEVFFAFVIVLMLINPWFLQQGLFLKQFPQNEYPDLPLAAPALESLAR